MASGRGSRFQLHSKTQVADPSQVATHEVSKEQQVATALATGTLERWSVARLRAAPRNARLHSPEQVQGIAASMRRFGFTNPLLVSPDGEIIAGHGRFAAAGELGLEEVPVLILSHLTEAERRAYLIADNRLAELATWDRQMLADEVIALMAEDLPAELLGFTDEDLASLLTLDEDEDGELPDDDVQERIDRASELQEQWGVEAGDLWSIGPHRLYCGDSTNPESYERLLGAELVDIVVTDPPYGVSYVGGTEDALTIENDELQGADLERFLRAALTSAAAACKPGAIWYVCAPAGPNFLPFASVLTDLGVWRQTLVWLKNALVLGRSDFHYRHEAIFYGWKPGAAHRAPPDRGHDTIWEFDRPTRNGEHPTMKPPALFAHAIELSSGRGALVLDPFAGSGTTLLAANAVGRVARCLELDPKYCAVILERAREQGLAPSKVKE